jgi:hypothetical protein
MIACALLLGAALTGCKSQGTLAAEAIGCRVAEVDVVKSAYSREGSTTRWCVRCQNKLYQCTSNPQRDRTECRPAEIPGPCGQ